MPFYIAFCLKNFFVTFGYNFQLFILCCRFFNEENLEWKTFIVALKIIDQVSENLQESFGWVSTRNV